MVVSKGDYDLRGRRKGAKMHGHLTRIEVWRHYHEELLEKAENARLAREIRRKRRGESREWSIDLGGWILQLRRIPEYEPGQAAKG
jgi:hypothetical protein